MRERDQRPPFPLNDQRLTMTELDVIIEVHRREQRIVNTTVDLVVFGLALVAWAIIAIAS
jgi:hypothetical protein